MQWLMLQQSEPEDFVIATGKQYSVRDFVNTSAKALSMDIEWQGQGVQEKGIHKKTDKPIISIDPGYFRPTEVDTLLGDPSKAKNKLGWEPEITFEEMVKEMTAEDLAQTQKDHLCRTHGFHTFDYNE